MNEEMDSSSILLIGSGESGGRGRGVVTPGRFVIIVGRPATTGNMTKLEDLKHSMGRMGFAELVHQSSNRTVYYFHDVPVNILFFLHL